MSAVAGYASPKTNISGYKMRQTPNFTPEQMNLFQQLLGGVSQGGGLSGGVDFLSQLAGGDESAFEAAEAPSYAAFDKMLGQLGSRYSQLGARDSSSFNQAVSGGASDLAQDLGAKRLGMQNSAIDRLLGLSQQLLGQQPYENYQEQKGGMDWGGLLGGAAGSLAGGFGTAAGKEIGSALWPQLVQLFSKNKGGAPGGAV